MTRYWRVAKRAQAQALYDAAWAVRGIAAECGDWVARRHMAGLVAVLVDEAIELEEEADGTAHSSSAATRAGHSGELGSSGPTLEDMGVAAANQADAQAARCDRVEAVRGAPGNDPPNVEGAGPTAATRSGAEKNAIAAVLDRDRGGTG